MKIDPDKPWNLYDKEIVLKIVGDDRPPWADQSEGKVTVYDALEDAFVIRISKESENLSEILQFARIKRYRISELENSFLVMLNIARDSPGAIREIVKTRFAKADTFQISNNSGEIYWRLRLMRKVMSQMMNKLAVFSKTIEPDYNVYIDYLGEPHDDLSYLKGMNVKDQITEIEVIQKSKPAYRRRMPQYSGDFHQEWKFLSRREEIEEIRFSTARTEPSADLRVTATMRKGNIHVTEEVMRTPVPTFFMGASVSEGISPLVLYNDYIDGVQRVKWLVQTQETGGLVKRIALANIELKKTAKFVLTKYRLLEL